jgi:zinc protease
MPIQFIQRAVRLTAIALTTVTLVAGAAPFAQATNIERLVTPGGIEVWVVRDSTVPLIAVDFAFRGGANQDPVEKPGVANLAADLLDEGAGELDSKSFKDHLERRAIELSFQAGRDYVRGTMRTLKENRDEAFNLLRLSLNAPRFESKDVERVRAQTISRLQRQTTSPNEIASKTWWETAFPNHPYGRPVLGTLDSVPRIGVDDLKGYVGRIFAREYLKIAVVGDIDAQSVGRLVDQAFGSLPAKAQRVVAPDVTPKGLGRRTVIDLDVPQAVVTFGGVGIARHDPDFMAAYVVNHILGGGSFTSRLYKEVREKRGLAYGVSDSLVWLNHAAILIGGTAVRAEATGDAIKVIEDEFLQMAKDGPTEEELSKAKTYLKGSFALGLDTSSKIANQLVMMQIDNLGIDYIDRRPALIDAVTLADAKRVAKRLLDPGLLVTVVGRPKGVTSKGAGE